MEDTDVSFRCNIVTVSEDEGDYEDQTMIDHSADESDTADAAVLNVYRRQGKPLCGRNCRCVGRAGLDGGIEGL